MYSFSYRRKYLPFKFTIKNVVVHFYTADTDKLWVQFEGGGGREVLNWSKCAATFGMDLKKHIAQSQAALGTLKSV